MGLLGESWDDPKSNAIMQLAGGLLSGNFGKGVSDYGSVMAAGQDQALKRQLLMSDIELKKLAEQRAQAMFKMQQDAYGSIDGAAGPASGAAPAMGAGATSGGPSAQLPSMGPTPSGAPVADQSAQLRQLQKMAIAGVPGAKEMFEIYKYKNDPMKMEQGSTYVNRVTGQREFMPKVGEGVAPDGAGNYGALPGYANAQASIEGAKARAVEGAKANLDPFTFTPKGATSPVLSSRGAVMGGNTSEAQMRVAASGDMGADPKAIDREIAASTASLKQTLDPESRRMLQAHIQDLTKQRANVPAQTGGGMELQSEAEKVAQVDTAKAGVVRDSAKIADGKRYGQINATTDRAIELLKSGPTASGAGSLIDSAANFFGKSTHGADIAAQLETLSGWMTANVPRMEGPQSDKDIANYRIMAAAVGDKTKPVSQRLLAAQELKTLQEKYADLNGGYSGQPAPKADPVDKPKSFKDFGYKSEAEVVKDAQNTIMRNPKAKAEVLKRLTAMGITLPNGAQGGW